jgi:hypothetical protein
MDQLAHVLVFGTNDEFLNLLDQGAYNMNLGNAYPQGLLPFVGALLFQSDPRTENILFMTDLNNLIPFGTRPRSMDIYRKLGNMSRSYRNNTHSLIIIRLISVLNSIQQIL